MGRTTRTFKLTLSSDGVDALIEAHCHLIRTTRSLIAWGMTLHVAVDHLASLPSPIVAARLTDLDLHRLMGATAHHVGASQRLTVVAARMMEVICAQTPDRPPPTLSAIYMLALVELIEADRSALLDAFARTQSAIRPSACPALEGR